MFSIPPNNPSQKNENPPFESIHNPLFSPISQAKSEQIKTSFTELTKDLNYSSLPIFLEFVTCLRNKQTSQDWLKELDAFAPHFFISLLNKYHAGNGALVALGFKEFIGDLNESCMVVAESRPYSHLFNLSILKSPIDGGAIAWDNAKKLLDKKTYIFCLYLEEDKKGKSPKPIILKQNFKDNHSIEQFDAWEDFEKEFQSLNSEALENYSHPFEFLKALMRITFIYNVIKRDSQEVLNINLIDGLISINKAQNDHFIKNEHYEASFSVIKMIESPDAMIKIIENGMTKEMPAKEALNLILNNYGGYFHLPQDFVANLIFFFTNRIKFLNEVMLPPASALMASWPTYRELKKLSSKAKLVVEHTSEHRTKAHIEKITEANILFNKGIDEMIHSNTNEAVKLFKEAENFYIETLGICQDLHHEPLEALLDNIFG